MGGWCRGGGCAQGKSTNFALEEKTRKRFAAKYPRLLLQLVAKVSSLLFFFYEVVTLPRTPGRQAGRHTQQGR
jgi:hypothetical protein